MDSSHSPSTSSRSLNALLLLVSVALIFSAFVTSFWQIGTKHPAGPMDAILWLLREPVVPSSSDATV